MHRGIVAGIVSILLDSVGISTGFCRLVLRVDLLKESNLLGFRGADRVLGRVEGIQCVIHSRQELLRLWNPGVANHLLDGERQGLGICERTLTHAG